MIMIMIIITIIIMMMVSIINDISVIFIINTNVIYLSNHQHHPVHQLKVLLLLFEKFYSFSYTYSYIINQVIIIQVYLE